MRFHSHYPLFQLWRSDPHGLMRADALSVARLEPTVEETVGGGAVLDLIFSDGQRVAVLPHIRVQSAFLQQRERTPLVWPRAAREFGRDVLLEMERLVLPWLQSLTLARQQNEEAVRTFGTADVSALFTAARDAGLLGAARYADFLPAFAPYVYAARFCANAAVAVSDPFGANGAAMLAERAKDLHADLSSEQRNALASVWFGKSIFGELQRSPYDVVIAPGACALEARSVRITLDAKEPEAYHVSVASAVPADVMISFDPDDAPVASTFSIRAKHPLQLRAPMQPRAVLPAGGSSGTILMLMRDGFERAPDADVDEARSLASRLRAEGFTVEFASPSMIADERTADLVHAIGVSAPGMEIALERMERKGVPIVASAGLASAADDAAWGPEIACAAWGRASDDGMLAEFLDLVALRKLSTEMPGAPPAVADALRKVDVVLAVAEAEETQLRERYDFKGEIVRYAPAAAVESIEAADIAPLAGTAPFVLVHAPVQWRLNLPLLACAAAGLGIPLVVAGAPVDVPSMRFAARLAPELVMHVPAPTEAQMEGLYRAARVYADISWAPQGLCRIARAAASGCNLLLSRNLHSAELWPGATAVDPASLEAVAAGLSEAWNSTHTTGAQAESDLFSAAIFAYSRAVAARQPA